MPDHTKPFRSRIWLRRGLWVTAAVIAVWVGTGIYHTHKPLPDGLSFAGPERATTHVRFLRDLTYLNADGIREVEQEIFDAVVHMIRGAERFILVDMFLFNEFQGAKQERTRALCEELTNALIMRKQAVPKIEIHLITDPINTMYGGMESDHLQRLRMAGVHVTLTNLERLRDSNPLYSSFWRLLIRPFGNNHGTLVPNPFGEGRVSLRSYFALFNFKANHRKTIVTDGPDGMIGLVTSANPHDGSSAHENVALQFAGDAALDLLRAEEAVLTFSGGPDIDFNYGRAEGLSADSLPLQTIEDELRARIVTENQIEREAIRLIESAETIDLVMFYLSDRDVVDALKEAAERGTLIRLILDPNKDAFGHEKGGIPNRQVASELVSHDHIEIRWADTQGEQCHSKMLLIRDGQGSAGLLLGSANYTRRNLGNLNLELDVSVSGPVTNDVFARASGYFETAWSNTSNRVFTTEYETYRDDSRLKQLKYRIMESTGLSTF